MPRKAKTTVIAKTSAKKTVKEKKTVKAKKTAVDKINATVAKWDTAAEHPKYVKLGTADFLDFLATNLENGEGVNYASTCGPLAVKPRKPKELLNAVKYLRRQAALGVTKDK